MKTTCSIIVALFFFTSFPSAAELKTFIKEYTYQASEFDSKASCRTIALEQVKRLLLQELGTYLENYTEIKNYALTKDTITALTAGIVQAQVIDEKWDGRNFWLKAIIKADPAEVAKSIDTLRRDQKKVADLEERIRRQDEALKEIDTLKKEVTHLKDNIKLQEQFKKSVDVLENETNVDQMNICTERMGQRTAALSARDWVTLLRKAKEDIAYCRTVYKHKPVYIAEMYENVAIAYIEMEKYDESITACEGGIKISYKEPGLHFVKARALLSLGKKNDAIKSFETAEKLAKHGIDIAKRDIKHVDKNLNSGPYNASKEEFQSKIESYTAIIETINEFEKTLKRKHRLIPVETKKLQQGK